MGLVTGTCFAGFGVDVTCVDVDREKVEKLRNGVIPIYEPGLDKLVAKNSAAGRLHFTTDGAEAVQSAQVVFLAVGTPPKDDGSPDMSYYQQAAKDVAGAMNGYKVLVTKSTVPVGTGKWLREFVTAHLAVDTEFVVASNPEFLREGAAIEDFMRPDRVVVGTRIVGLSRAMELLVTGRIINADEMLAAGLVSRVVPHDDLLRVAQDTARDIARDTAPASVAAVKRLLWRQLMDSDPRISLFRETEVFNWIGKQPDAGEGVRAFLDKRAPAWTMTARDDAPHTYDLPELPPDLGEG